MKDVFILGAGFSKAINPQMPTMAELSSEAIAELKKSTFGVPETLYALGENVELWMSYLSQSQPWLRENDNMYNLSLSGRIRQIIKECIDESTLAAVSTSAPEWLNPLVMQWHRGSATIITLNYDTLVERASTTLSVSDNREGISLEHIYPPHFSDIRSRTGSPWSSNPLNTFTYLKLHGSINWHYSGREDFYGETIYYSPVSSWGEDLSVIERDSREQSNDKDTLIIPPVSEKTTYFNNETVRSLWQQASSALEAATRVFVIGYSLPISDLGMRFFLQHAQPIEGTPTYIIDKAPDVVTRYRELLPKLSIRNDFVGGNNPVACFVEQYPTIPNN